jgi:hypothetical protein
MKFLKNLVFSRNYWQKNHEFYMHLLISYKIEHK